MFDEMDPGAYGGWYVLLSCVWGTDCAVAFAVSKEFNIIRILCQKERLFTCVSLT